MARLRIGHTSDADDAFMFFGWVQGAVSILPDQAVFNTEDIEALNQRARAGEMDMTAISAAVYPAVAQEYRITASGAAMARGAGPVVVARRPLAPDALRGQQVAIPGENTTAHMLLRIYVHGIVPVPTRFDRIADLVAEGAVQAGLLIHQGPMTYASQGLVKVLDLGEQWSRDTGLPLPLGLNVVHRRLGVGMAHRLHQALAASIRHAQEHEGEAMSYAGQFSPGLDMEGVRRFVNAFVNRDALQMGEEGRHALETLYQRACLAGIIQQVPPLDIVGLE
ncbi:MAG: MqnA/MqnD/SBP family protein [Dehalococcoidia bacterium]|nr:MqnA/MqnD/SBP family protein [Dehalococcoidia bacterium]